MESSNGRDESDGYRQALKYIVEQIHTVVMSAADRLYFLTAKGKNFYKRLKKQGRIVFTGIKGESTVTCAAVSVRAGVKYPGNGN